MQLAFDTPVSPCLRALDQAKSCNRKAMRGTGSFVQGFLSRVVASIYEVDTTLLLAPNRGNASVALARQIAMYLAHVSCGLTLTEVGRQFGRDRTTVAHACEVVEELRENLAFDRMIELLELSVLVLKLNEEDN